MSIAWHSVSVTIWREIPGACTTALTSPSVVTIGNFDGVHRGHRMLIDEASRVAEVLELPVVAVTFFPHPVAVFAPDRVPATLTTIEERVAMLKAAGADMVYVLAFDKEMAAWSPDTFVTRVIVDQLHAVHVVVGTNFTYGSKAAGDVASLEAAGREHGFEAMGVALGGDEDDWSSTLVRQRLAAGDVARAAEVLGRWFSVSGTVVRGDQRGRDLGFPTANLPVSDKEIGRAHV